MSDRIIKLVFLRVDERKCVVPLVEGCDFQQFMQRVRRRIGLGDDAAVTLSDTTGPVDSIDRLLEIDEGSTLTVQAPSAPSLVVRPVCATPASNQQAAARRPAAAIGSPGKDGGEGLGAMPDVRVDVPNAEWARGEDDTGALKYRKRRRDLVSLVRSRRAVLGLLLLTGLGFGAMHVLT